MDDAPGCSSRASSSPPARTSPSRRERSGSGVVYGVLHTLQ